MSYLPATQSEGYQRKLEFVFFGTEPAAKRNASSPRKTPQKTRKSSDLVRQRQSQEQSSKYSSSITILPFINEASDHSLAAPQNRSGYMALLRERYVPELPKFTCERGELNGASWIATACSLALKSQHSEMLSDSLLAMSLSLVGLDRHEGELSTASLKQYSRALNGLRSGLAPRPSGLSQHQVNAALVTSLACGMYEMMTNKSLSALMHHLNGVSAILKTRGVENLQSDSSRRTFYEYRSIHLPIALSTRKANFLSLPKWINPPWKTLEPLSASKLGTVIDIGFEIPVLMEKFDNLQQQEQIASVPDMASQMNSLILDGLAIQQAFNDWERRIRGRDDMPSLYIPRQAKWSALNLDVESNIYPISFDFANWDNASGLSYYEMLQIFLNTLLIDIKTFARRSNIAPHALAAMNSQILAQNSIDCADRICQSVEWFLEDNKKLIGRMVILAPFESARALFARLSLEATGEASQDAFVGERAAHMGGIEIVEGVELTAAEGEQSIGIP
ncbi:uncharacterized protein PAC_13271 [Phialocephala subalpina]|uniref:Negative acting factor n=1 Tax=Phialocephala subalpina TaxID=576137 RepID=A0A1L7XEC3_9HELO|nr:uncharacterized protein PAC_13271 [Phialocephala subalpina]